ncbi:protein-disulfide reductase DsbD family protein [Sphingoaurantiacus capsulatus]|uniref:Protein-disulfide reductase DsbD family protein n=1 Tax=Sphingoaurantiacus capsulatus TaxID=1771310 RepID=A0ABV7XCJ6_9SPHN
MIRWFAALALLLLPVAAAAQSSAKLEHTSVELVAESARPAPGGKLTVGLVMKPIAEWHTYWVNPGDAGAPTRAVWTLPPGATASELRYPTPETFVVAGLMNHVYSHENVLLAEIALPAGLAPGAPVPVTVKLDWLVCDDELCVPEGATLKLDLTAGDGAADPAQDKRFADARAALPKAVDWPVTFRFEGDRFQLAVPFAQAAKVTGGHFFPAVEGAIGYAAPQSFSLAGDKLRLETTAEAARELKEVPGILKLDVEGYDQPLSFEIVAKLGDVPASTAPIAAAAAPGSSEGNTFQTAALALLAAVAGGLLLNIMPCVFPILSLKALSLARSGTSEAEARREGLAYTAGVVLTCLALGGLILALRAAGASVGWAFQLQDPRVIAFLFLLMVAIGLNLAGLYEIDVAGRGAGAKLAEKGGAGGAFWTGVLAAFVATPCTGPFMGVALGAAIALPPAVGLAVFAGLGFGLALPFLLLGFVPALRRRLPKPGAWMDKFRRILSIPMFMTAVGLAWVLGRQAGVEGMTLGLAAALLLGLALWWLGRRQGSEGRNFAPLGLAAAALFAVLLVNPVTATRAEAASDAVLAAETFSPEKLASLTAERKPTFVYFTADWCITCKVNERGALGSSDVAAAFDKAGVTTLVGDWTNADPVIAAFLESRGRNGIPLYLFYRPDGTVEELPQILTVDRLTGLVA